MDLIIRDDNFSLRDINCTNLAIKIGLNTLKVASTLWNHSLILINFIESERNNSIVFNLARLTVRLKCPLSQSQTKILQKILPKCRNIFYKITSIHCSQWRERYKTKQFRTIFRSLIRQSNQYNLQQKNVSDTSEKLTEDNEFLNITKPIVTRFQPKGKRNLSRKTCKKFERHVTYKRNLKPPKISLGLTRKMPISCIRKMWG